jgi:putative heme-binding domain-containing protein
LIPYVADEDGEISAQVAKVIGDVRYTEGAESLLPLLQHESARVRFFAAEALGRMQYTPAIEGIISMLDENDDEDVWLRHAGSYALSRIGEAQPLIELSSSSSRSLRIAATVALRRMRHAGVAAFLNDIDEYIVTEAARAIHDDYSIDEVLPNLAALLGTTEFTAEPLIRRAISANLRLGEQESIGNLLSFASNEKAPSVLRAEALDALGTWGKPSVLDRVDGRFRGEVVRDETPLLEALENGLSPLLSSPDEAVLQAAIRLAGKTRLNSSVNAIMAIFRSASSPDVRTTCIKSLQNMDMTDFEDILAAAITDESSDVRTTALESIKSSGISEEKAVILYNAALESGSLTEKQTTLTALGQLEGEESLISLTNQMRLLSDDSLDPGLILDLVEAVKERDNATLNETLTNYQSSLSEDVVSQYEDVLYGGDRRRGAGIFYRNSAAQCVRCHAVGRFGGDAGPKLNDLGKEKSREYILTSLVDPSAALSPGYGIVTVGTEDEEITGILMEETEEFLNIKLGADDIRRVDMTDITSKEYIPSSMPGVKDILSRREIRDLMAFLIEL